MGSALGVGGTSLSAARSMRSKSGLECIGPRCPQGFNAQILLECFEQQLYLPMAAMVAAGRCKRLETNTSSRSVNSSQWHTRRRKGAHSEALFQHDIPNLIQKGLTNTQNGGANVPLQGTEMYIWHELTSK